MTTALKAINGGSKQRNERKQPDADKSIRPHCKVSIEDINWVRQQPPSVQQLWLDSVAAEQFGGSAHKLDTNLTYKSLQKAGAALTAQGLFQFEELFGRLPSGRPGLIGYRVRNLHGYYNRFYWESSTSGETNSCDEKAVHAGEKINHAKRNQNHPKVEQIHADLESFQKNGQKSKDLQGFQKPNNVSNYPLTTYQQPTKVVGMVVGSDALTENPRVEETAHAPLRGASPSRTESASELEESPTAMDCTTLALVDDAEGESALLLGEKQDCGVEPTISHEGICSAAPVAQNEKSLNSAMPAAGVAIANQTQGQAEQSNSASLLEENQDCGVEAKDCHEGTCSAAPVAQNEKSLSSAIADQKIETSRPSAELMTENSVSCDEVKAVHEGESSAAPVSSAEKWSHEAIVTRANVRPERMQRLKLAGNSGQNPGFDFLQECWDDDPALQIVIKKLLAKFPQWGIAIVDGVLVDWEE
ncbi:hypothetical protein H6G97_34500 [Nostoc flagelliforme FACHB-838]|uniref:Methyl-accepting chemotaxis protein n=1 Tax=Nostoc flagelliforme FACHB-838 TaxID=2692904 RepID=A0ABR8DYQ8_9NOSO|nr:hypothetical protein [Nostoc flagelliforme]MBD2534353.1 hypothetical protein [Nostoc flagelliforme FACHB-838]